MKKVLTLLTIALSLLLTGCTVTSNRIYTVCRVEGDDVYVYNADGEFFRYVDKKLVPYIGADLQPKPKLTVYLPEEPVYNLEKEIPTVYAGTKDDALGYIAKVMLSTNAEVQCPYVDWKSFTAYIRNDTMVMRVLYTTDNKVRIYAQDVSGNTIAAPYLE